MSEAWQEENFTADELAFDEDLRERLRSSLDVAGPSEEAEERMLANLLAAQGARGASGPVAVKPIELPKVAVIGGGKRGGGVRRRRLALAAAAALAAVALGVGVLESMRVVRESEAMVATYDAGATGAVEADKAPELVEYEVEDTLEATAAEGLVADSDELTAMGGAFDATSDPSYEFAVAYPEVRLHTGEALRVEEHDGAPVIIEEQWVEQLVGEAEAFTDDGSDSVGCWVYRLPASDDGLYAVRYVEDGSCFAIRIVE